MAVMGREIYIDVDERRICSFVDSVDIQRYLGRKVLEIAGKVLVLGRQGFGTRWFWSLLERFWSWDDKVFGWYWKDWQTWGAWQQNMRTRQGWRAPRRR